MNTNYLKSLVCMRTLIMFSVCFQAALLMAQPKINSPYSRYGLGELSPGYLAQNLGMGGVATAYQDPIHLNANNPAALAGLDLTAFESGLFIKSSSFTSSANDKLSSISGNLGYLGLGFTLRNVVNETLEKQQYKYKIGMGVFLEPVATTGYNISSTDTISSDQLIVNQYEGDGGYYRVKYGIGVKRKNTSIGAFIGWQFGKTVFENTTIFDTLPSFQNNFRDELRMNGLVYSIGAQHNIILKRSENNKDIPTKWVTIGLSGNAGKDIGLRADQLKIRSRGRSSNGAVYIDPDTLLLVEGAKKTIRLPATISFGLMYNELNRLRIGADIGYAAWSDYTNEIRPERLKNTFQAAAGVEYTPDFASYNNYMRRVRYRFGGYFRQDPRQPNGETLNDVGITLGLGFPLVLPRQQTSAVHFALELGQLGAGTAIKENYIKLTAGYTLNDNSWFYKRRFD